MPTSAGSPNGFTPRAAFDPGEGGVEIGVGGAGSYADVAERNAASQEPDETARKGKPETKERPPAAENVAATAPNRNVSRVASADGGPVVMATPDRFAVPGRQARGVKSNQQLDDRSEPAVGLRRQLLACLGRHQRFLSAALPHKILPPIFSRYAAGHRYGPHMDNPIMPLDGTDQLLRTGLSATIFLTAPDEYDGGELTIETAYGPHAVKQNAGDLILYPSGSLHQVTPVTRGTRLCALLWIQSMVRDTQRRTLLFDLDRSVQALTRERGTTDAEVRRLTGVYHTLVRLWADV